MREREVSTMWILRALAGTVLWLLAGLLGLVGAILCVTIILLPVGIPVLALAKKLFAYSMVLFLPRKVRHPVDELKKSTGSGMSNAVDKAVDKVKDTDVDLDPAKKRAGKMLKAVRSFFEAQRKRLA